MKNMNVDVQSFASTFNQLVKAGYRNESDLNAWLDSHIKTFVQCGMDWANIVSALQNIETAYQGIKELEAAS